MRLSRLSFVCLIIFPILAMFNGIGMYFIIKSSANDAYISIIVSFIVGLIMLYVYLKIFDYRDELSIFEKNIYLFGKIMGNIINIILSICVFLIGIVLLYNISNFSISEFLDETPLLLFMLTFSLVIIYNVSMGINNISRVSFSLLIIIFILSIVSTLGVMPYFDIDNLKPVLNNGILIPIKSGTLLSIICTSPIFILLSISKSKIDSHFNLNKWIFFAYIIAYILIFLATFLTLGALGIYLSTIYQYPEYIVLKKISLFNFMDRIENIIYLKWFISSLVTLSLIVVYMLTYIKKDSNIVFNTILNIFIVIFSFYYFNNNTFFYYWIYNILPYVLIIYFAIHLIIFFKIKTNQC